MKLFKSRTVLIVGVSILISACNSGSSNSSTPSITYQTLNYSGTLPAGGDTGLTGIRQVGSTSNVYITGSYSAESMNNGTLYVGPINGGGTYYVYNYPGSNSDNVYSADNGSGSNVMLTGSYTTEESGNYNFGFVYDGPVTESAGEQASHWITITPPWVGDISTFGTIPHSIMGGFVVGNYQAATSQGTGFIYNIANDSYESVTINHARYTSLYGIWDNGDETYTVVGGYTDRLDGVMDAAFIADYESGQPLSNITTYYYNNESSSSVLTHFEGITTDNHGGYNLAATGVSVESGESVVVAASFVNVPRKADGTFGTAKWIDAWYPNSSITTSDTVYENHLLGVYEESGIAGLNGYVANIPTSLY